MSTKTQSSLDLISRIKRLIKYQTVSPKADHIEKQLAANPMLQQQFQQLDLYDPKLSDFDFYNLSIEQFDRKLTNASPHQQFKMIQQLQQHIQQFDHQVINPIQQQQQIQLQNSAM
jgi:hypothetical protein